MLNDGNADGNAYVIDGRPQIFCVCLIKCMDLPEMITENDSVV